MKKLIAAVLAAAALVLALAACPDKDKPAAKDNAPSGAATDAAKPVKHGW